jgi:UDP-glucose 4-epimerase
MRILITGGAGFIGSHLSEALISKGESVIVLDDLSTGNSANLTSLDKNPKFTFVKGSILDEKLVDQLIASADGVIHLAAAVGVQKILDDPIGSMRTNIQGSEIVMENAARLGKATIIASSSEIYGKSRAASLSEDSDRVLGSPLLSRWSYSEAKAIDESLARALFERNGWPVKIVRFFNTVGPRQSGAYGMVIPRFISAALANEPLLVYGDGSQRRVFCHVADAVAGVMALWDVDSGFGEAFNLGGFEETTINDLAARIIEKTGSSSTITYRPYADMKASGYEDMPRRVPNTTKLSSLTGWKAERDLDRIIDETIAEIRSK